MAKDNVILAVDDFRTNITILEEILSEHNFSIIPAINGNEALEKLKTHPVDLILLDILMPGMSGYDVCNIIKQNPQYKDIPILFVSTKHDEKDIIHGFKLGAQDFITKPFRANELIARINTQIDLRNSKIELKELNSKLELKVSEKTAELSEAMDHLEEMNRKLIKAHNELLKLDEAKMEFLKIISHEIRTPLNGIIGFSEFISNSNPPEEYNDFINVLKESGRRLEEFSEDALMISQLQLNKFEISPLKFKILHVLTDEINRLKGIYNKKEYEIIHNIDEQIEIYFDNFLFRHLIYNILENSIKYSSEPGKIWINYKQNNNLITEITIEDNGKGFNKNILNKGGKLFISEHYDKNPGLGFTLIKLIMKQHNGKLSIKNSNNGGAIVNLIFDQMQKNPITF